MARIDGGRPWLFSRSCARVLAEALPATAGRAPSVGDRAVIANDGDFNLVVRVRTNTQPDGARFGVDVLNELPVAPTFLVRPPAAPYAPGL